MTPTAEVTTEQAQTVVKETFDEVKKFLDRTGFLNQVGVLREEEKYIDGLGWVLLSEISGLDRAMIVGVQSLGLLAEQRKIDRVAYERALILAGVIDPSSPKSDRKPLFRPGDMDRVMRLGGQVIAEIVDGIESLSALGTYSGAAEGNSDSTQSGDGTS